MKQSIKRSHLVALLIVCLSVSWIGYAWGSGREAFYNDPYGIPLTPSDDGWFSYERKSARENRDEIALAVDPTDGAKARAVRDHLADGGRFVILVCGYTNWGRPTPFERPLITYANDHLDAVVLQVNYQDAFSPWYIHSFKKGVDRTTSLVLKARKAGAGRIRIYGKSQGSDVTGRVVAIMAGPMGTRVHHRNWFSWWRGQGNPDWFEGGFLFGNPAELGVGNITVTSYAAPPKDAQGKRGGLYRYEGYYNDFYYGGKLVLFNRVSDPATYGGIADIAQFGMSAHEYQGALSYPDFLDALEAALDPEKTPANTFDPAFGDGAYVDRAAGERFDFMDSHFVPFIPQSDGSMHCTLTVANAAPNTPMVDEASHVLVTFYDAAGRHHHDETFVLAENASHDIMDPLRDTRGSAVILSDEPVNVVVRYGREDQTSYYTASYPSEAFPSRTLYVPYVAKGRAFPFHGWRQTTEMVLFNPSSTNESDVDVHFYRDTGDGTPGRMTQQFVIPARGTLSIPGTVLPREWRSPGDWGTTASCVIRASTPICGMVRNRIGAGDPTGEIHTPFMEGSYRAFATRGQGSVHVPLIAEDQDGYGSRMLVQNTGTEEATFTVWFSVQGEGCVGVTPPETLAPGATRAMYLPESVLVPSSRNPFGSAANAVVQVEDPFGKGTVAVIADYAHPEHGALSHEGIPEGVYWSQKRPDIVDLPLIRDQHRAEHTVWDAAIHVVNMGTARDDVLVHYHAPDGSRTFDSTRKQLDPDGVVAFWGSGQTPNYAPPDLFAGSGKVEGSSQKLLGATVQLAHWGKEDADYHDILLSYSAWW